MSNDTFANKPHSLFAIFDGHNGSEAVSYVAAHLPLSIIQNEYYQSDIKKAIFDAFAMINESLTCKAKAEVLFY